MTRSTVALLVLGIGVVFNSLAAETNAFPKWTVPKGWVELAPGPAMEKAYSPLPGSGKTIIVTVDHLPNVVHHERLPLVIPSFEMTGDSRKPIRSTLSLPDANDRAVMIDMEGMDSQTHVSRRFIFINVARTDEEWLYKIIGDTSAVNSQKDAFIQFVQSACYVAKDRVGTGGAAR